MEPEGSLLISQVSATCPYPEPALSSPYPPIPLPEDSSYYYSQIYGWVSHVVSFPQVSPTKPAGLLGVVNSVTMYQLQRFICCLSLQLVSDVQKVAT
jgi:hypothetical protein